MHFPAVDPEKIATEIPKRFGQRQSLCHYTLKDNKVQLLVCLSLFLFWPCGYNLLHSFIRNHSANHCDKLDLSEAKAYF